MAGRDTVERKRAEQARREGEERFRLIANTAPVMIWMSSPDKLCTYFNQSWLEFTGRALEAELGNGWIQGVHIEDRQRCLETYSQAFDRREPFKMEYRLRRHDREYRWIHATGVPRLDEDVSFAGYIGSCIDITDLKTAEEALRTVSGKLIEAQEQERSRIARDLHDDISQRLAMVAIELQQIQDSPPESVNDLRTRTEQLLKRVTDISSDVQALSHRLHAPQLKYLGIVAAINSFCREFAEQQKVRIDFSSRNIPPRLPEDVSLCLFRVIQEALHNAARYSGVRQFEVKLRGISGAVQLIIRDSGVGFDPAVAAGGHGLGLVSMRERVNLMHGTLTVASKPARGTTVIARIPIAENPATDLKVSA